MDARLIRLTLPLVLGAAAMAGAGMAASSSTSAVGTVDIGHAAPLGAMLVSAKGRTLYRFTHDAKGVSRCDGVPSCSHVWPALLVPPGTTPTAGAGASGALLGTIGAAHGMRQVTYAGYPLYLFSGDTGAGQAKGQGIGGAWFAVSGTGALIKSAHAASKSSNGWG